MLLRRALLHGKLGSEYKCSKMAAVVFVVAAWQAVLLCLLFAVIYVGSLYVWGGTTGKDRYDAQRESHQPLCLCFIVPLISGVES